MNYPSFIEIDDVLISMDCITEEFCCNLDICKGACCVEGDAGAPVTMDEIAEIEEALDMAWDDLSVQAQAIVDKQGVAYIDQTGELVTSIVNGKDCAFTRHDKGCCLCIFDSLYRQGTCSFQKPISCALYPIREKKLRNGIIALNYDRWDICRCGREKGKEIHLPLYQFLKEPLIRRFGKDWYAELEHTVKELKKQNIVVNS